MDPADVGVTTADVAPGQAVTPSRAPRRRSTQLLAVAGAALFVAFWTWALFFASKEAVNRIGDRAWAQRAESICEQAAQRRSELTDFRVVDPDDPAMVAERGDIVDRATDVVEAMLDDVVAIEPTDDKGRGIVPLWEADYRTHVADRRTYADVLRSGRNAPFTETAVDGIPISDKLAVFAGDNEMASCAPPTDLS